MGDGLKALDIWYQMPPGSVLWQTESRILQDLISQSRGDVLLQVGGKSGMDWIVSDHIKHKVHLETFMGTGEGVQVQTDLDAWPILPNIADVILLAHVLEHVSEPEVVIEQAFDALAPGGVLVVLAFNQLSLWGLKRLIKGKCGFPWGLNFFTTWRLHTLLTEAGFEVEQRYSCHFRPALSRAKLAHSFKIMDTIGSTLYPLCGASLVLVAHKNSVAPVMTKKKNKRWVKAKSPVVQS